jgi:hypothetical protein
LPFTLCHLTLLFYFYHQIRAHTETQPALVTFFRIYQPHKVFTPRVIFVGHFKIFERACAYTKLTALAPLDMKFYVRHEKKYKKLKIKYKKYRIPMYRDDFYINNLKSNVVIVMQNKLNENYKINLSLRQYSSYQPAISSNSIRAQPVPLPQYFPAAHSAAMLRDLG